MRERLKNVILVVLAVGMAFLIWRTWAYEPAVLESLPGRTGVPTGPSAPEEKAELTSAALPVQVAARSRGTERMGALWDGAAVSRVMPLLRRMLGEALGSAANPQMANLQAVKTSLSRNDVSLYLCYSETVPLQALGAWNSAGFPADAQARWLAFCAEGDVLRLYYEDEKGMLYTCVTAARAELPELGLESPCFFAFERGGVFEEKTVPLTLLPETPPKLPKLSAQRPDMDTVVSLLLPEMGMDPGTPYVSTETDGTRTFVDYLRQCRVSPDGYIDYYDPSLDGPALSPRVNPPVSGYIEAARRLCDSVSDTLGDAVWELRDVTKDGNAVQIRFGARVGGCPILGDDGAYALFTVEDNRLEKAQFYFRSYWKQDAQGLLLPLEQGLASVLRGPKDKRFSLGVGYLDGGLDTLTAEWMMGG